ncbi:hypothetical protein BRADI_2g16175v3 [Brachypodium distachyon]|uniref:Uncharacterized protein n=1 Tax=Brachypodium distachyon TaxID=15368 RepID=A0A0Q3QTI9_BRADI|nr:hypothetical protein BRADI_2g16175v3 [Brachypodium distachyon]
MYIYLRNRRDASCLFDCSSLLVLKLACPSFFLFNHLVPPIYTVLLFHVISEAQSILLTFVGSPIFRLRGI